MYKKLFLILVLFCFNCIKDYQVNYQVKHRLEPQKKTIATNISGDINDIICEILKGNDKDAVENFYNIAFKNTILELVKQDYLDLGLFKPYQDCTEANSSNSSCGKISHEANTNKPDYTLDANIEIDNAKNFKITVNLLNSLGAKVKNLEGIEISSVSNEYSSDSFNDLNPNVVGLRKISIELFRKMKLITKLEEDEILKGKVETSCLRAASEFYKGKKNQALIDHIQNKIKGITSTEKSKLSHFIKKYKEKEEKEENALKRNFGQDTFFWNFFAVTTTPEEDVSYEEMIKKIDPKENYKNANYLSLKKCLGEKTRYLKAESNLNNLSPLLPPVGI